MSKQKNPKPLLLPSVALDMFVQRDADDIFFPTN